MVDGRNDYLRNRNVGANNGNPTRLCQAIDARIDKRDEMKAADEGADENNDVGDKDENDVVDGNLGEIRHHWGGAIVDITATINQTKAGGYQRAEQEVQRHDGQHEAEIRPFI